MDTYPNIWPKEGLFNFSGVDGETCHTEPFIMCGRSDGIGWSFHLKGQPRLLANLGNARLMPRNAPTDFVLPDCWYCSTRVNEHKGLVEGGFVAHHSFKTVIGFEGLQDDEFPDLFPVGAKSITSDSTLFKGDGWWMVVAKEPESEVRSFGVAISYASLEEAEERAQAALKADLRAIISKRLGFYTITEVPESILDMKRRCYIKSASVLKANIESPQGRFTSRWFQSDPIHHRSVRLWDCVFHLMGLQYVHKDLARDVVRSAFKGQRKNGQIPLSVGPEDIDRDDERLSHPPLLTWALSIHFDRWRDPDFMARCYPKLVAYIRWFEKNRRNENGLYGWHIRTKDDPISGSRGAESGMSNSPRFDNVESMTAIDLSSYMANEYLALSKMAEQLEHHAEAREWREHYDRIRDAMNELLWDFADQFYYDLDEAGEFIPVKTTAGLLPLLARVPDRDQAEALRTHIMHPHEFWTQCPLASVSEDEEQYSRDMWRGAAWPTMNALVFHGLENYMYHEESHALAHNTINEIAYRCSMTGGIFEYYDPRGMELPDALPRKGAPGAEGGSGFGVIHGHQPTAATYIHLIQEITHPG